MNNTPSDSEDKDEIAAILGLPQEPADTEVTDTVHITPDETGSIYRTPIKKILKFLESLPPERALKTLTKPNKIYTDSELFQPENAGKRIAMLACELATNKGGLVAPYFRPTTVKRITVNNDNLSPGEICDLKELEKRAPKLKDYEWAELKELKAKRFTPAQNQITRDFLLIDIHWIALDLIRFGVTNYCVEIDEIGSFWIIKNGEVDLNGIVDYCAALRTPEGRVEDLGIQRPTDQILMRVAQWPEIQRRKRNVERGKIDEGNNQSLDIKTRLQNWQSGRRGASFDLIEKVQRFSMLRLAWGDAGEAVKLECFKSGTHFPDDDDGREAFSKRRDVYYKELRWYRKHMKGIKFLPFGFSGTE